MMDIRVKRVYEPPDPQDGYRVLVDRLWPRGMTKDRLQAELWLKDVAPSTELRNWYHHDLSNREEFKDRYFAELEANQDSIRMLLDKAKEGPLTLLYAARDEEKNHAIVLRQYLLSQE